jgi:hypothetical protein
MVKPKINIVELTVFATLFILFIGLSEFAELKIGSIYVDLIVGFAILFSLSGLSVFNNIVPGIIIGAIWGYFEHGSISLVANIANCELSVLFALGVYHMTILRRPESPFNVYIATFAGSIAHIGITYGFGYHHLSFLFISINLIATAISLVLVSKLREMGLINHEDPDLVAKIDRDFLQDSYNAINRRLNTNLQRPRKPQKF